MEDKMEETIHLLYPEHSKMLRQGILRFYQSKDWADLIVKVQGSSSNLVHTFMIALFVPKLLSKCMDSVCDLTLLNIDEYTLALVLDFIYKGEASFQSSKLETIRDAADKLGLTVLSDLINIESTKRINVKVADERKTSIISASNCDKPLTVGKDAAFHCSRCEFRVELIDDFKEHLYDVHQDSFDNGAVKLGYKCRDCEFIGENRQCVSRHRKAQHQLQTRKSLVKNKTFKCCNCDFQSDKKLTVIRHFKLVHSSEKELKCSQCDFNTSSAKKLKSHQLVEHNTGDYACVVCGRKFTTSAGRQVHYMMTHMQPEDRNACYLCSFKTKFTYDLKQHLADEHNIRRKRIKRPRIYNEKKQCVHCGAVLNNKTFLIDHLADKHRVDLDGNLIEPKYNCERCDFVAYSHVQLYRHNYKFHSKVEFRCDRCPFKCKSRPILRDHVKWKHLGEKHYMCEICGQTFGTNFLLSVHKKVHKQHSGGEEQKLFLTKKVNTSLPVKLFQCESCDKSFTQKCLLKQHTRHVHDENARKHKCNLCSYAAKTKWNLGKHVKSVHKEITLQIYEETQEEQSVRENEIAIMEVDNCELIVEGGVLI